MYTCTYYCFDENYENNINDGTNKCKIFRSIIMFKSHGVQFPA